MSFIFLVLFAAYNKAFDWAFRCFLVLCSGPFRDCLHALEEGHTASGMYLVRPDNANRLMQVWCNQRHDPGGWTVIQRKLDGSVNFFRNWEAYKVLITSHQIKELIVWRAAHILYKGVLSLTRCEQPMKRFLFGC